MSLSFFTIDDVYDDPDNIRDIALNAEYNLPGADIKMNVLANGNWPGITSLDVFKNNKIDGVISRILGLPVRQIYNSGKFRLSFDNDMPKSPLHIDEVNDGVFAGVLYLNKLPCDTVGTILYKHKKTGAISANKTDHIKIYNDGDMTNINCWDVDILSYIRYNRLIVYPANRYHGAGPSFGTSKDNARLVQLFLWQVIK